MSRKAPAIVVGVEGAIVMIAILCPPGTVGLSLAIGVDGLDESSLNAIDASKGEDVIQVADSLIGCAKAQ